MVGKVHCKQIPHHVRLFSDDAGIKGPKSRYNEEEISPGIRRFVWEHAQIFRQFLYDAWVAGLTISGFKSAIGMPGVNIVGVVCDYDGRRPEAKKVQKILDWPAPQNVKQARGFVGIVVYYRIFIKDFATIAAPIYQLFRKGKDFVWGASQQLAMNELKSLITTAPVLVSLDFSAPALPIILHCDASTSVGWGAILSQRQSDGTTRPASWSVGDCSGPSRNFAFGCLGGLSLSKQMHRRLCGFSTSRPTIYPML